MRVYEFAKAKGITSAAVIKMAEANDVEVYSALTQLEDDDVETLSRSLLQGDAAGLKAEAAAVAERRRAKIAKAAAAQAEKNRTQAEALYADFGKALSAAGDKWSVYLLSSDQEFERSFGRPADKKRKLYNGMIRCDLYMYFKKEAQQNPHGQN